MAKRATSRVRTFYTRPNREGLSYFIRLTPDRVTIYDSFPMRAPVVHPELRVLIQSIPPRARIAWHPVLDWLAEHLDEMNFQGITPHGVTFDDGVPMFVSNILARISESLSVPR